MVFEQASRYQRSQDHWEYDAGSYKRKLLMKAARSTIQWRTGQYMNTGKLYECNVPFGEVTRKEDVRSIPPTMRIQGTRISGDVAALGLGDPGERSAKIRK